MALKHRFVFNSMVSVVVVVAFVFITKHKKLAESNSFFEMQMELECLSTVPVALMGQSVDGICI